MVYPFHQQYAHLYLQNKMPMTNFSFRAQLLQDNIYCSIRKELFPPAPLLNLDICRLMIEKQQFGILAFAFCLSAYQKSPQTSLLLIFLHPPPPLGQMSQRGNPSKLISLYHPRQEMGSPSPLHISVPVLCLFLPAAGCPLSS